MPDRFELKCEWKADFFFWYDREKWGNDGKKTIKIPGKDQENGISSVFYMFKMFLCTTRTSNASSGRSCIHVICSRGTFWNSPLILLWFQLWDFAPSDSPWERPCFNSGTVSTVGLLLRTKFASQKVIIVISCRLSLTSNEHWAGSSARWIMITSCFCSN